MGTNDINIVSGLLLVASSCKREGRKADIDLSIYDLDT